ncbi:MAG: DUF3488 and DUF4129 domain-containing transglutaminase family protein [Desulfobulbaceae bacterium]|nr:DUF3488 and DUF4129 domain-containing transglutaminase family protein [Desulfobulbaceae bacterium]
MKKEFFVDRHALPILSVIVVCTLPHFFNISMWAVIAILHMWGFTVAAAYFSWRLPGRMTRLILVGIFFLIAMATNEGFTIEAFVSLLALMICLKVLDIRNKGNRMTTVILCYFLIVGTLFFDDSIYATTYMLISVLFTTAVLIHVNQPGHRILGPLKLSALLMVQALPLMILLFMLFPRIEGGGLGRAPIQAAQSGFSDRMGFGDIANMAQNREVAFRVEFDGDIPQQDQLYWRGVVLWDFDGHTWRRGGTQRGPSPRRSATSGVVNYTLTLEPHNEHWLITLDLPMRISLPRSWLYDDFSYYRWREITQRVSYTGISYPDSIDVVRGSLGKDGVNLPPEINPRARALAVGWYEQSEDTRDYINKALAYFREQPFLYTLNPPPLPAGADGAVPGRPENLVDVFLFESRKGFCEHYATAFAFLMRAAGVPARVVVGYLGGVRNLYGEYLVVRQSQAHAWCEVWVDGKGWIRVDPTAAVAPDRLSGDIIGSVPDSELIGLMAYFRGTPLEPFVEPIAGYLDFINSRWNKWVMGYSAFEQVDLFSRFGIDLESGAGPLKALMISLMILASMALAASIILLRRQKPSQDQPALSWIEFCQKLGRVGLERNPGQGPIDYQRFVLRQRPEMGRQMHEIVDLYVQLRYGRSAGDKEVLSLQRMVKKFQPKQFS